MTLKVAEFLQQPATKIAEFITGLLVSDNKDWKLSAGRLVQASIKSKLYSQLGKEINEYIKKGKIKDDFLDNAQNFKSLSDLLEFIDEATPDNDRFNAVKDLFFYSVAKDSSEAEQVLSYQFMKLCKELDSGNLLVLKATYDINNKKYSPKLVSTKIDLNERNVNTWLLNISKQIGHEIVSLVEVHEDKLINLKLIGPRTESDRSGIFVTTKYRLTDLGYKVCEFIYNKKV